MCGEIKAWYNCLSKSVSTKCLIFASIPIPFEMFILTYCECCFQCSLLSIRTQRYLMQSFWFMEELLILILMIFSVFLLFEIIRKLDLSTLRVNLFADSHFQTFLSSWFTLISWSFAFLWEKKCLYHLQKDEI